jgi:hypothetical protein
VHTYFPKKGYDCANEGHGGIAGHQGAIDPVYRMRRETKEQERTEKVEKGNENIGSHSFSPIADIGIGKEAELQQNQNDDSGQQSGKENCEQSPDDSLIDFSISEESGETKQVNGNGRGMKQKREKMS